MERCGLPTEAKHIEGPSPFIDEGDWSSFLFVLIDDVLRRTHLSGPHVGGKLFRPYRHCIKTVSRELSGGIGIPTENRFKFKQALATLAVTRISGREDSGRGSFLSLSLFFILIHVQWPLHSVVWGPYYDHTLNRSLSVCLATCSIIIVG